MAPTFEMTELNSEAEPQDSIISSAMRIHLIASCCLAMSRAAMARLRP